MRKYIFTAHARQSCLPSQLKVHVRLVRLANFLLCPHFGKQNTTIVPPHLFLHDGLVSTLGFSMVAPLLHPKGCHVAQSHSF